MNLTHDIRTRTAARYWPLLVIVVIFVAYGLVGRWDREDEERIATAAGADPRIAEIERLRGALEDREQAQLQRVRAAFDAGFAEGAQRVRCLGGFRVDVASGVPIK
jgi:hypothetical protein